MSLAIDEASKILGEIQPVKNSQIDPITIIAIAQILIEVLKLVIKCYNNNDAKIEETLRSPGAFAKVVLATYIRKHTNGLDVNRSALRKAILNIDQETVKKLLNEVKNES